MRAALIAVFGAALAAAMPAGTPTTNAPTLVKRKSYPCSQASPYPEDMPDGCYTFCDTKYDTISGPSQSASARVKCDTSACTPAHVNAVSVTTGYTVTAGLTAGVLSGGATFDWSKSVSSSDSYSFTLKDGDDGYIMFIPTLNRVCGDLKKFGYSVTSTMGMCSGGPGFGGGKPAAEDANACFTAAQKLSDGTANGLFTFCSTNGTGCNPLPDPSNKANVAKRGPVLTITKPAVLDV